MMTKQYFLNEGHLTTSTPSIKEIANKVEGTDIELLQNIFDVVNSILILSANEVFSKEEFKERIYKEHLQRTVDEVVRSGYNYGCDEYGILFCTIARLKGIPTKYIQCAEVVSFATKKGINGHVYLECFLKNGNYLVDSTKGTIVKLNSEEDKQQLYFVDTPERKRIMVESYSGLDSWEAGIKSHEDMVSALIQTDEAYLKNHAV